MWHTLVILVRNRQRTEEWRIAGYPDSWILSSIFRDTTSLIKEKWLRKTPGLEVYLKQKHVLVDTYLHYIKANTYEHMHTQNWCIHSLRPKDEYYSETLISDVGFLKHVWPLRINFTIWPINSAQLFCPGCLQQISHKSIPSRKGNKKLTHIGDHIGAVNQQSPTSLC